jgi:DNA-directed RNA polymerase III subunit RPC1
VLLNLAVKEKNYLKKKEKKEKEEEETMCGRETMCPNDGYVYFRNTCM